MKTYLRKMIGKMGIPMKPKCLYLIHVVLFVAHLLFHPNNMAEISGSLLLK